ncbi:MAG: hypothetical protein NVS1B10_00760 [Candidatus Saccharimonadales bacterium]
MHTKSFRKRAIRIGLVSSNLLILAIVLVFVLQNPKSTSAVTPSILTSTKTVSANPLDQVSSADIALTVARMSSLPETTAVTNQAQSQAAEVATAVSNNNVITKPQVVQTALKSSADIKDYTTQPGDTVTIIASKFGVTSDSIKMSNNLTSDSVSIGAKIVIPPVNGLVYTVSSSDTADTLAAKYHANKDKIVAYNDAEIKGLNPGQRIIIPDAVAPVAVAAAPVAVTKRITASTIAAGGASAGAFAWGNAPVYGSNGYDFGYCTWYVATQIPVPSNWGNANTWAYYAPSSGWSVSKRPVPGSIAQSTRGSEGHVAIVSDVSADGTMIKYSDMNGLAGWGRVGTTPDWVPASHFNNFIYH